MLDSLPETPTWLVDCAGCSLRYEQTASGPFLRTPHCCGNCGRDGIRVYIVAAIEPGAYVPALPTPTAAPEPETAQGGRWYCYEKQAWIFRGIVERCGHTPDRAAVGSCYACGYAGTQHETCASCH